MVDRNELITICRQIGGMMEAGVDILRITRVLRAQTFNARLLQLYDALDHDMTMGHGLADAMSHAPDVFSPFMVLMVQQGEARNDLAGAFFKIADYLQKDSELTPDSSLPNDVEPAANDLAGVVQQGTSGNRVLDPRSNAPTTPLTVIALDGLIDRLQTFALRALTVVSGLLLSLAGVWWSVEMGWLERRWLNVTGFSVAAIFMGVSGIVIQRRIQAERRRETRCSFCGRPGTEGDQLQRAPRFAGAAICSRCAAIAAHQQEAPRKATDEAEQTGNASGSVSGNASDDTSADFANTSANGAVANGAASDVTRNEHFVNSTTPQNRPASARETFVETSAQTSVAGFGAASATEEDFVAGDKNGSKVGPKEARPSSTRTAENSRRATPAMAVQDAPVGAARRVAVTDEVEEEYE